MLTSHIGLTDFILNNNNEKNSRIKKRVYISI